MMSHKNNPRFSRHDIADEIVSRIDASEVARAKAHFAASQPIQNFYIDDLLPQDMAREIMYSFPDPSRLYQRKSIRESKYVTSQMNSYSPLVEEAVFAFHDVRVVDVISEITGLTGLLPDRKLYAGGISMMAKGDFLNPHLDNSHDHSRELYRILNLLYYCTDDWKVENGGNLEVWRDGVKAPPTVIPSLFNRLVIMTTGSESWHSVSMVMADSIRRCVSNYYFGSEPLGGEAYTRVTSFRGRPEQPIRDFVLRVDAAGRQLVRKLRPQGVVATKHLYVQSDPASKE